MGIEPTSGAWEAHVLPMNYARLYVKNDNILNCFWQGNLLKKISENLKESSLWTSWKN